MAATTNNGLFTFFSLVRSGNQDFEVKRIPLTGDLQRFLTEEFTKQNEHLLGAEEHIPYSPQYRPEDECMFVEGYELPDSIANCINRLDTLNNITSHDIENGNVFGLFAGRNSEAPEFLFQVFDNRRVLHRDRWSLLLSGDTFVKMENSGIKVGGKLNAVYREGRLYFRSEYQVRRILPLDVLFRKATDEDVDHFMNHSLWETSITRDTHSEFFKDRTRKKITAIMQSGILDSHSATKISESAKGFGIDIEVVTVDGEERIKIPEEKRKLDEVLSFLNDDFLGSNLTESQYRVTSKRRLNS